MRLNYYFAKKLPSGDMHCHERLLVTPSCHDKLLVTHLFS